MVKVENENGRAPKSGKFFRLNSVRKLYRTTMSKKILVWYLTIGTVINLCSIVQAKESFKVKILENRVMLESGGASFEQTDGRISMKAGKFYMDFSVPAANSNKYLLWGRNQHAELVLDKDDHKVVSVTCAPNKEVPDICGEWILEIRKGLPCIFIKAKLRNVGKTPILIERILYRLMPKEGIKSYFVSEDKGVEHPYLDKSWDKIGKHDWIYICSKNGGGLGLITSYNVLQGAGGHYLGWTQKGLIRPEKTLDMEAVIYPASDVKKAMGLYERIKKIKTSVKNKKVPAVNRIIEVKRITAPPSINGQVTDREWQEATRVDFVGNLDGEPVSQKTRAYIGYDNKNLYFAFVCDEDEMGKLKATVTERDANIWVDDCVEIFLNTDRNKKNYYHFILNSIGTQRDSYGNKLWNANWNSAVCKGKNSWTAEAAIPFKALGIDNLPQGQVWGFNLCREERPHNEISSFNPTGGGFHNPLRFAAMVIGSYKENLQKQVAELKDKLQYCSEKSAKLEDKKLAVQAEKKIADIAFDISFLKRRIVNLKTGSEWLELSRMVERLKRQIRDISYIDKSCCIWQKNPMLPITRDQLPPESQPEADQLKIFAFMNEKEPASFVITNFTSEAKTLRVVLRCLRKKGNPDIFIDPGRIDIREGLFVGHENRIVLSDALPLLNESNAVIIPGNQSREIWLNLNTKGIPPGCYSGNLYVVDTLSRFVRKLQVEIEISPVRLPDKKPCEIVCFAEVPSKYSGAIAADKLEKYFKDLSEHYCSTSSITEQFLPYPVFDSKGKLKEILNSRITSEFDRLLKLHKKYGIKLFLYWNWKYGRSSNLMTKLERFSPEWNKLAEVWLKELIAHIKSFGFDYADFSFVVVDEVIPAELDRLIKGINFIRKVDPKIRLCQTAGGKTTLECIEKLDGLINIWLTYGPYGNSLLYNDKAVKIMKKPGNILWFYNNYISEPWCDSLNVVRRSAWGIRRYKTDGGGFWGYANIVVPYDSEWYKKQCSLYEPVASPYCPWLKIYWCAVYDDSSWRMGPVPSRRWEIWRDGIEDYTCLYLLEKSLDKKGIRNTGKVQEAKAVLDEFDNKVYASKDPDDIYKYRILLGKTLLKVNADPDRKKITPAISLKDRSVTISWNVSQQSRGIVYYKKKDAYPKLANIWQWKMTGEPSLKPSITLTNLENGEYIFCFASISELGVAEFNDNAGKNYRFVIK